MTQSAPTALNGVDREAVGGLVEAVTAKVTIDSPASREQLEGLHTKVLASSPVGHTIGNAVPVDIRLA